MEQTSIVPLPTTIGDAVSVVRCGWHENDACEITTANTCNSERKNKRPGCMRTVHLRAGLPPSCRRGAGTVEIGVDIIPELVSKPKKQ